MSILNNGDQFSAFFFNVNNPQSDCFRLASSYLNLGFRNENFAVVLEEKDSARVEQKSYLVLDTPDCILLRHGLLVQNIANKLIVSRFSYADLSQEPQVVDSIYLSGTDVTQSYKYLDLAKYGLEDLATKISPKYPIVNSEDKLCQVAPLVQVDLTTYDNTGTQESLLESLVSTPVVLNHFQFEMVNEQDLLNSVRNLSGFTLFENPRINSAFFAEHHLDYIIPYDNSMLTLEQIQDDPERMHLIWTDYLSSLYSTILPPQNEDLSQAEIEQRSSYFGNHYFYRDAFERPHKFSYYTVNISMKNDNLNANFLRIFQGYDFSPQYVPRQELIHLLNYLHLYNPADYYVPGGFENDKQVPDEDYSIEDFKKEMLLVEKYYYLHSLIANFAPKNYTFEMAIEFFGVLQHWIVLAVIYNLDAKDDDLAKALAEAETYFSLVSMYLSVREDDDDDYLVMRRICNAYQFHNLLCQTRKIYSKD